MKDTRKTLIGLFAIVLLAASILQISAAAKPVFLNNAASVLQIGATVKPVFLNNAAPIMAYAAEGYFHEDMPADPGAPENVSADFVVFGDSQGRSSYLWPVSPHFDDMLLMINEIDVSLAFHTGDMIEGDNSMGIDLENQLGNFLKDTTNLEAPVYPVMGNHDARSDGWEITRELVFDGKSTWYSFNSGGSHFIVLDAFVPGDEYKITGDQLAWLEIDLRETTESHIFVFAHAPLYPTVSHIGNSLDKYPEERDQLADLLKQYGVDVFFAGHEHCYISFEYDGLLQITSSGAGCKLRSPESLGEMIAETGYDVEDIDRWKAIDQLHYVCVNTTIDTIEVTAYDFEGNIIDTCKIN